MKNLLLGLTLLSSLTVSANSDTDCKVFSSDNGISKKLARVQHHGIGLGSTATPFFGEIAGLTERGAELISEKGYEITDSRKIDRNI